LLQIPVCLTCGDVGFEETLVFCNKCKACALHRYLRLPLSIYYFALHLLVAYFNHCTLQPLLSLSRNVTPKNIETIHIASHHYPEPFLDWSLLILLEKAEIRFYILVKMDCKLWF